MAIENKYRVHEVAKDFGAATKEITEIPVSYTHLDVYKRQVQMSPYDLTRGRITWRSK